MCIKIKLISEKYTAILNRSKFSYIESGLLSKFTFLHRLNRVESIKFVFNNTIDGKI